MKLLYYITIFFIVGVFMYDDILSKPKAIKREGLPCRVEYKQVRLRQMALENDLARYDSCIEGVVTPSNEFAQ